ncbi:MAG: hypothetical protein A2219_05315 [Elusimicrobia bacterium RIFOXYA2_FULL_50_26]|nr:MAG: hypothetical protein A2219_05315 [Elusimicrobia bacterium RIFOXYA2_FULL_50_26]OGS25164.1 MAG: hypothetical protein A2314_02900 [Elusimicrobia bacterium RIFOXYB2_FULL_50_12]
MSSSWKTAEIVGSEVFTVSGEKLGTLFDVLPTGTNDVWIVRSSSREILIPALKSVVVSVDVEKKTITVELPRGLKEIYEPVA